jgi:uncharacterized Fe-S cluster-containing MiaB family protein
MRYLKTVRLEISVAYRNVHSLTLLDGDYRPPVLWCSVRDAVVVTIAARND